MRPYELFLAKTARLRPDIELAPHQQEAVERVARTRAQLLAHGTGTGKTGTSAAAVERLRELGKAKRTLAVVPAPLIDNYADEGVKKFTDQSVTKLGPDGTPGHHHIDSKLPNSSYYVVSNEMFRKDPHKYIDRTGADTVIWDEAHKGRSEESLNYHAMKSIRHKVKNFIALTGTPAMNHPHDIVPLIDVVSNGQHNLGTTAQFDKLYTTTRTRTHGPLAWAGIGPKTQEVVLKNQHMLRPELNKHIHYVPVEDVVKNMPKKIVHTHEVEMSPHQKSLYDFTMGQIDPATRAKIKNNVPVSQGEARSILTKIVRTRQLSNAVHTMDSGHDAGSAAEATPKMRRMLDDVHRHLQEHPGNKAIVYTNLVHGGVDAAVAGLKHRGYEPGVFTGTQQQARSERTQHIKDYMAGHKRVMVINSAGTEGLNLPGTTAHFTLDGHFNPKVTEQAEARGIRAGSPVKEVHVHRYLSTPPKVFGLFKSPETSVDQWVYNVAARKEHLNNQVLTLLDRGGQRHVDRKAL
jgi:SNF2 family DNA or RNA helicase